MVSTSSQKPLVLVADSQQSVANMLGHLIAHSCDCEVVALPNGEEAVRVTLLRNPEAVVLEVSMPGIGGIESARTIRTWLQDSAPLLVGLAQPVDAARSRKSELFDHVLTKPVEIDRLLTLLEAERLRARRRP